MTIDEIVTLLLPHGTHTIPVPHDVSRRTFQRQLRAAAAKQDCAIIFGRSKDNGMMRVGLVPLDSLPAERRETYDQLLRNYKKKAPSREERQRHERLIKACAYTTVAHILEQHLDAAAYLASLGIIPLLLHSEDGNIASIVKEANEYIRTVIIPDVQKHIKT